MGAPIGVGDWVECIDATGRPNMYDGGFLVAGRAYQVERLTRVRYDGALRDGLNLFGQPSVHGATGRRGGYWIGRFKPILRPSESLFLTRLLDVPALEPVDA